MKILLTAPPGTGKSTVIAAVVAQFPGPKRGIVARENLDESGRRTGFTAINQAGQCRQFMFPTEAPTDATIGGLFDVDVPAIDDFVVSELGEGLEEQQGLEQQQGLQQQQGLLYVDEAGRAQAKSSKFLGLLRQILASNVNVLGSIVYEDEPWSLEFKRAAGVCILEVSLENRGSLPKILLAAFGHHHLYEQLAPVQKAKVNDWLLTLVKNGKFISAQKLFTNALGYVVEGKIKAGSGPHEFLVAGQTSDHRINVTEDGDLYRCDCPLSNGTGDFAGSAAICSHEMALKLKTLVD